MDKKIVEAVMERSKGLCENCYMQGSEMHHVIFGNSKRKKCENEDSVILLCYECHRGTYGVHGREGRKLDLELKIALQEEYFKQGYSENKTRELMGGKIYG